MGNNEALVIGVRKLIVELLGGELGCEGGDVVEGGWEGAAAMDVLVEYALVIFFVLEGVQGEIVLLELA